MYYEYFLRRMRVFYTRTLMLEKQQKPSILYKPFLLLVHMNQT